jgi:hypothetical protein
MSRAEGSSPLAAGRVIGGKYRLVKPLGEGAMGAVWHAVNEGTGGGVALKLVVRPGPDLRVRLLREARACCSIRHKNVVQVYDVGEIGGDPFLVMELLSGQTLADVLSRRRRLGQEEAAAIARDVARALAAAHDRSIVHRDLKPANIFLHDEPGEERPVVKVLDFGVSKNLLGSDGMRTVVGGAVGSPMYMSPEQVRADTTLDGRSDIWSLGVILYEMLTGMKPFSGDAVEVVRSVLTKDLLPLSRRVRRIDPGLEALVMACLERPRERRPWPAADLARLLEPFARSTPRLAAPAPAEAEGGGEPTVPFARPSGPGSAAPPAEPPGDSLPAVLALALEETIPALDAGRDLLAPTGKNGTLIIGVVPPDGAMLYNSYSDHPPPSPYPWVPGADPPPAEARHPGAPALSRLARAGSAAGRSFASMAGLLRGRARLVAAAGLAAGMVLAGAFAVRSCRHAARSADTPASPPAAAPTPPTAEPAPPADAPRDEGARIPIVPDPAPPPVTPAPAATPAPPPAEIPPVPGTTTPARPGGQTTTPQPPKRVEPQRPACVCTNKFFKPACCNAPKKP